MPKTKRDRMKGSVATALLDLERATIQVAEVAMTFEDVHPELIEGLQLAVVMIDQTQQLLETFYNQAWGDLPENLVATRDRK